MIMKFRILVLKAKALNENFAFRYGLRNCGSDLVLAAEVALYGI
jgi:hypothetical protein